MAEIEGTKYKLNYKDIKSSDIIKTLFSFLNEKQKLKMIIYSNKLKNILLVDIECYKKISGKFKIGEKNGKGKEYKININILLFEGEYLNGKRNGKGKNIMKMVNVCLKENFLMGKGMEKE